MTTSDIQLAISSRFDFSGSSISNQSNEWGTRLILINEAEDTLKRFLSGQWSFLLISTVLTTVSGQNYVDLPEDYERGSMAISSSGWIVINNLPYQLVEYPDTLSYSPERHFAWIKGNKAKGYKLYIQPTPADAYDIPFNYYSGHLAIATDEMVTKPYLKLPTDITKIPDPYFLVDWVLGELYLMDDEKDSKWQQYKASAQNRLLNMATVDGREQNESITIKLTSEEQGFDIFNSNGDND